MADETNGNGGAAAGQAPPKEQETDYTVAFDDMGVRCERPDGTVERIDWEDLHTVTVEAPNQPPPVPALVWILWSEDRKSGCIFPGRATGADALIEELKRRLDGFDHRALVTAMNADEHMTYVVWQQGLPAAQGGPAEAGSQGGEAGPEGPAGESPKKNPFLSD